MRAVFGSALSSADDNDKNYMKRRKRNQKLMENKYHTRVCLIPVHTIHFKYIAQSVAMEKLIEMVSIVFFLQNKHTSQKNTPIFVWKICPLEMQ